MQKPVDFSSMTLDELTPIVSMRPGKEYTREELRAARAAFMARLGNSPVETVSEASEENETAADEISVSEETEAEIPTPAAKDQAQVPASETSGESADTEAFSDEEAAAAAAAPSEEEQNEEVVKPDVPSEAEESTEAELPAEEEFILKAESRLARFLYILYAYLLVPVLAAEALVFLLASVAAAVAVPDIPYLFIHILCAVIYTMVVSVAWHQFLHRTQFGLLLNRALIAVCIFRGISMLLSEGSFLPGVIFVALSSLFLVFFVGYDSTFTVKSPKKPHAQ